MKIKFRLDIVLEGEKSDFLSIRFLDKDINEFEKVLDEYENSEKYGDIISNIADRIKLMANKFGIREEFFKDEGPNNVYRFRNTGKEFRLLCLPYGKFNLIIGGAAIKLSGTETYQENPDYLQQIKIYRAVDKVLLENEIDFSKLTDYTEQIFEIEIDDEREIK